MHALWFSSQWIQKSPLAFHFSFLPDHSNHHTNVSPLLPSKKIFKQTYKNNLDPTSPWATSFPFSSFIAQLLARGPYSILPFHLLLFSLKPIVIRLPFPLFLRNWIQLMVSFSSFICCDLSASFNTVDHLLFGTPSSLEFQDTTLSFLLLLLFTTSQISFIGSASSPSALIVGIPQDSVLGSFLLSCYTPLITSSCLMALKTMQMPMTTKFISTAQTSFPNSKCISPNAYSTALLNIQQTSQT